MAASVIAQMKPRVESFTFGPWTITETKSHILTSEGPDRDKFEDGIELPQFPEMIFAENILRIMNSDGYGIEFNARDALKLVNAHQDLVKVAVSKPWQEARAADENIKNVIKPFDWTYTTDYKGTLIGKDDKCIQISDTTEKIDLEKLKVQEKIHFYSDTLLFEDELADNGCSIMNVKIRVMPTSFFVLMRFFLRVDDVLVRVNDTRLYHECGKDYMLREYSSKENKIEDLKVPGSLLTNPNEISPHLETVTQVYQRLQFPTNQT